MKAAPKTAPWNSLTLLGSPADRRVHISNGVGIAIPIGWSLSHRGEFYKDMKHSDSELRDIVVISSLFALMMVAMILLAFLL